MMFSNCSNNRGHMQQARFVCEAATCTSSWLNRLRRALCIVVSACALAPFATARADEKAESIAILDGWRIGSTFAEVVIPLWVTRANGRYNVSYTPVMAVSLSADGKWTLMPHTGQDSHSSPLYFTHFTSWAAPQAPLCYFSEFRSGFERMQKRVDQINRAPTREEQLALVLQKSPLFVPLWRASWSDLRNGRSSILQRDLDRKSSVYESPSGRSVIVATYSTQDERNGIAKGEPSTGRVFLLWEPAASQSRDLLRVENPSEWAPYQVPVVWSEDEKHVYVAVGSREEGVEKWRLCECGVDSRVAYRPETTKVLFSLTNRNLGARKRAASFIGTQVQALCFRGKEHSLVFYRGDTDAYWAVDVNTGQLTKCFPSPFGRQEHEGRRYREWSWWDARKVAVIYEIGDQKVLSVADPMQPENTKELVRWPGNLRCPQWVTQDVVAFLAVYPKGSHNRVASEIRTVNTKTGVTKVLVSERLQERLANEFWMSVSDK